MNKRNKDRLCGCGCGVLTYTGWTRGHKFRVFPRKFSDEEKKRVSLKFRGKRLSFEHRQKISRSHLGKKGHPNSEEFKKKLSERWSGSGNPKWQEDREKLLLRIKLRGFCHGLLKKILKRSGKHKQTKTSIELGYTVEEFRLHMESLFKPGMTWENHGRGKGKWHIDHIRPIASFPVDEMPRTINALSNLQPLWEEENFSKGSKFDLEARESGLTISGASRKSI